MTKRLFWLMALLVVMASVTACSLAPQPREKAADLPEEAPVSQATSAEVPAPVEQAEAPAEQAEAPAPAEQADAAVALAQPEAEEQPAVTTETVIAAPTKYGLVSGPIDDKGFNQLAWAGLQKASQELGFEIKHSQTGDGPDYSSSFNDLLKEGYTGIVSVGFGLSQATKAASNANPEVIFLNVDFPSLTASDVGLLFSTDEPGFMAGYLAAGMSETGVVCTYGGQHTPPVLSFMVGFEHGVKYFNQQKGAGVQLLGWQTNPDNPLGGEGIFAESFDDRDGGRTIAENFFGQGCDIIFPVAGATGLGSAEAAQARGAKVIGVDADQSQSNPEFANVYLTSVLKKIDVIVYEAVKRTETGDFTVTDGFRSNFIGTLANGGVGLAPFYGFDAQVPQELKNELAQLEELLSTGNLSTGWPIGAPAPVPAQPATGEAQPPADQPDAADAPAPPAVDAPITLDALRNGTYLSDWTQSGTVILSNGEYREAAAPGSATETVVKMSEYAAFGDLTGNGVDDATVILITDPGGSGTFYDLAVMINKNGVPVNIASIPLGDRVQIKSLAIQNGEIVVNLITHSPNDAQCCPTQEETKRFSLNLVEAAPPEVPPETNFAGVYNATMPSASSPGINVTLILGDDGNAQMISDYMNGEAPIIETGTWASDGDSATVSLTSLNGRPIDDEIVFEMQGDMLVSTVYDPTIYGSEGLSLQKQ